MIYEVHPSTSVLRAKGFEREIGNQIVGCQVAPFSYYESGGRTHAIDGLGQWWSKLGSAWPGPDFAEISLANIVAHSRSAAA